MARAPFKGANKNPFLRPDLIGEQGIIALPQDWRDDLVGLESKLPFLTHVIRRDRLGTDHQHQPLARDDCFPDLLVKRQQMRRQGNVISPNFKAACLEGMIQPFNKRLVFATREG